MNTMEIVLLILGIAAFVISYFIPEGKKKDGVNVVELKEQIDKAMEEQLDDSKKRLEQITDETVSYSVEKTERALDRLTNEKILAVGEYSDTVMAQINSNHQETVFMHDMLNKNKKALEDLLNTATKTSKEANDCAKEASELAKTALKDATEAMEKADVAGKKTAVAEDRMIAARKTIQGENTSSKSAKSKTNTKKKTPKVETQQSFTDDLLAQDQAVSIQFAPGNENTENNNERILELHKKGRSNMAIAKDLGLGYGEVKLVIDLFEKK